MTNKKTFRVMFIAGIDRTIYRFRMELIKALREELECEIYVACNDTGYISKLEAQGLEVIDLPISRSSPISFTNLHSILILVKLLKKLDIDIIHTNTPIGGLIGRVAGTIAKVPYIFHTTGGFYFNEHTPIVKKSMYAFLERTLAKATDYIFSVNNEDIQSAKQLKIIPKNAIVYTGGAGVDTDRFNPENYSPNQKKVIKKSLNIPLDTKVVTFIGRVVLEKGIIDFIGICEKLKLKFNIHVLIVGDPVFEGNSKQVLLNSNLKDSYTIAGLIEDIPEILSITDLLLFPSYREGMPVAPLEAMAMKVPVVAYDIRGCREEISHRKNGFLSKFKDKDSMYQYCDGILGADGDILEENPRQFILENFTREIVVSRQTFYYKKTIHAVQKE